MDDLPVSGGDDVDNAVQYVQLKALCNICRAVPSYKSSNGRNRKEICEFISSLEGNNRRVVQEGIQRLLANPTSQTCKRNWLLKRKQEDAAAEIRNVRARLENIKDTLENHGSSTLTEKSVKKLMDSNFMQTPPQDKLNKVVHEFIERTGNNALKTRVCACCARELEASKMTKIDIEHIPNATLLKPTVPHPNHELVDGYLLERYGLDSDMKSANLCDDCYLDLERNQLPSLALANNMWIGRVPECLGSLTLVERLLIAKYFPTAYIVKLYPKQAGSAHWDSSQLYSGYKGTVSTYSLDPKLVQCMVEGNLLPAPPSILSATVAVTFITPHGKPEFVLPRALYARRQKIREALQWLKSNNPLYNDITISEERLQSIPVDDVPDEIRATAKHSTDIDSVIREHEAYVPADTMEETNDASEEKQETEGGPSIIPLSSHGVVDIQGLQIPDNELMGHALLNSATTSDGNTMQGDITERYAYKRGGRYINEYARTREDGTPYEGDSENPNHLLGSFPTLFPYGKGGFETDRPVKVTYEKHIKWALSYHDKRFRLHEQFIFQVFGVTQKREVCRSVSLQIRKAVFTRHAELIQSLRPEDLRRASQEEVDGVPFSHSGVRMLRQHLRAVRSKVTGTDENRMSMRSKVWSTCVVFNPPSLWLTINPSDHDPIAQVIAGSDIDLDKFIATAGPDSNERARKMASDPFASAKFFHFMIATLLDVIFGIRKSRFGITRRAGVFGTIQAYIGTVEAQGRGTLHLHMLIWLKDAPPASVMQDALKDDRFRSRVTEYIKSTIRADINGKGSSAILQLPKRPAVSYSRPINPVGHEEESNAEEMALARTVQFHKCNEATCIRIKNGKRECKRRAPFALSPSDWVNAEGEWGPKRMCPNMNAWNSSLMRSIRANHDVKLIMNGAETCVLVLYTTNYTFKKQSRSSNASALLADRLAYHQVQNDGEDLQKDNKRLIQRCANALFTQREFSGPEIVSYLMGWGDRYESHSYVPIYLDGAIWALKRAFPELVTRNINYNSNNDAEGNTEADLSTITVTDRSVELRDQLRDYQFRGEPLHDLSLFDFLINTYEDTFSEDESMNVDITTQKTGTAGRPKKRRIPYLSDADKSKKCRVERNPGHEMLPRFIGKWFSRNNNVDGINDLSHASILLFFKPWRSLQDLKSSEESFQCSYITFLETASEKVKNMLQNIQYYHDCWDVAQKRRDAFRAGKTFTLFDYERDSMPMMDDNQAMETDDNDDLVSEPPQVFQQHVTVTEQNIEHARLQQSNECDRAFAREAMLMARAANVFGDEYQNTSNTTDAPPMLRRATQDDIKIFNAWEIILKEMTRKQRDEEGDTNLQRIHLYAEGTRGNASLRLVDDGQEASQHPTKDPLPLYPNISPSTRPKLAILNVEQRKAHDIIENHMFSTGNNTRDKDEQLLMLVIGHGGTGKSVLIDAVTETFVYHQESSALAKCATSGVASTHVGGCTVHSWAGLGIVRLKTMYGSRSIVERRKRNILGKKCLIIDEMSMLYDVLLADVAKVVNHTKKAANEGNEHLPFAGMNVILMGDFHQFPPVGKPYSALYSRQNTKDSDAIQGRALYRQFETVVCLREQIRVKDIVWTGILDRLRIGQCTDEDIHIIRGLILNDPLCPKTDFSSLPWSEAVLITTRHTVREAWNAARLKQHCRRTGNRRYIISSEDYITSSGATLTDETRLQVAKLNEKKTKKLSDRIEIAIGMKAMILVNLSTEAEVANGTRGTITGIVLDPREERTEPDEEGAIRLTYPPALILFEPDGGSQVSSAFVDQRERHAMEIPNGQIPLTPCAAFFTVTMPDGSKLSVTRRQYALTGGYAFTDFKSQGQTIEVVVVDLRNTPTGKISPFTAYVALSRSRGRDTIRLLSGFDEALFKTHPNADLEAEMQRLGLLAK